MDSTTRTDAPLAERSTSPLTATSPSGRQRVAVGDTVLVHMGDGTFRPMMVNFVGLYRPPGAEVTELRLSGALFCDPRDTGCAALRLTGDDPAQIYGQPTLQMPLVHGTMLKEGSGPAQWRLRPR